MTAKVIGPNGFTDFKPLNPWGRPMPKPKRVLKKDPDPLYQVMVEQDDGTHLPIGPQIDQVTAQRCCEALSLQLRDTKSTTWHNPVVVRVA